MRALVLALALGCSGASGTKTVAPAKASQPAPSQPAVVEAPPLPVSKAPVIQLALGGQHSCALHEDGAISCWGDNWGGQLGDGTTTMQLHPIRVKLAAAQAIAASGERTCAVAAGDVWCWGSSSREDETDDRVPVRIAGVAGVTHLAAGCAVAGDHRAYCWREANDAKVLPLTDVVKVAGTTAHGCAVHGDGKVSCWGPQLDEDEELQPRADSEARVVDGVTAVVQVTVGEDFQCARRRDGSITCWGLNHVGQLGRGRPSRNRGMPRPESPQNPDRVRLVTDAVDVAAGYHHACARTKQGRVLCWGANQAPNDFKDPSGRAEAVDIVDATVLAAGNTHSCAVTSKGVHCWGRNGNGQMGNGWASVVATPVRVAGIANATHVVTGNQRSCARLADGRVQCWGDGSGTPRSIKGLKDIEQLGGESVTLMFRDRAGRVFTMQRSFDRDDVKAEKQPGPATDIAGTTTFLCALIDSKVFCWGEQRWGEFGNGKPEQQTGIHPTQAATGIEDATKIGVGAWHGCAIRKDRSVWCWGDDLDDDTLGKHSAPHAVGIANAVAVSGGIAFTCAIVDDGRVMCFGGNQRGELGYSATGRPMQPKAVTGITDAVQITSANETSCVRRKTGKVMCWGRGVEGQLGATKWRDGNDPAQGGTSRAIEVEGLSDAIDIATSGNHTCAVVKDGSVWCWGDASDGQVGTFTAWFAKPTPVVWR